MAFCERNSGLRGWLIVALSAGSLAAGLASCGGSDDQGAAAPPPKSIGTVKVLSNRADLVSGGDALVEIVPAAGVDASALKVDVDGTDVTSAFAARANGRFMGLVSGLKNGSNVLSAKLADGSVSALKITNHPNAGPMLYGPKAMPWACDAGATDTDCNRPVSYVYKYVSTNPALRGFQNYDPANPAGDSISTIGSSRSSNSRRSARVITACMSYMQVM